MKELEIEIKAYCQEIAVIKQKLAELGAVFIKTERESDRYFNHPEKDFGETDEALRLRTIENTSILTYKGPKISKKSKARVEKEVFVQSGGDAAEILECLGFRESGTVVKMRDYYTINDITICVDEVEDLGSFVEIEKKGENLDFIEKEIFDLASDLGLDKFERRSYLELILDRNKKRSLNTQTPEI